MGTRSRSTRLTLLVLIVAGLAGFAAPAAGVAARGPALPAAAPAAETPPEATIQIAALQMFPARLEVTTGTEVTWVNSEPFDYPFAGGRHQVTADDGSWSSPDLAPGTRWTRRFNEPGTFRYRCVRHAGATGEIVVTGEPVIDAAPELEVNITEADPDDPTTWAFSPAEAVVEAGTTVVWRNNGKSVHTVTSEDGTFDSGDIAPGATWRHTFDSPGAFGYRCTPHPWMTASVRVAAPGGKAPPAPPAETGHAGAGGHAGGHRPGPGAGDASPAAPIERTGRGPVRHHVAIIEPDPAKPTAWAFRPAVVDVVAGDTVVWRNDGRTEHTVTGDGFDSGLLPPGGIWERTFEAPGTYDYRCTPHPWMKGSIRVVALGDDPLPRSAENDTGARAGAGAAPRAAAGSAAVTGAATPSRASAGPVRHDARIVEPDLSDAMNWRFVPADLTVVAGDTVVWHNTGTLPHTVTGEGFDSGLVDSGGRWERRFDRPGVYAYRCTPHPWMTGVVRVAEPTGAAVPGGAGVAPAAGSSEQAAGALAGGEPAPPSVTMGSFVAEAPPSRKFGLALAVSATIVLLTSAAAWGGRRRPAAG